MVNKRPKPSKSKVGGYSCADGIWGGGKFFRSGKLPRPGLLRSLVEIRSTQRDVGSRIPVAFAQPFLKVGVRGSVRVVVDAGAQPRPSLDERDLQAGLGQHIRSDPTAGTTTDNADVVDHRCKSIEVA